MQQHTKTQFPLCGSTLVREKRHGTFLHRVFPFSANIYKEVTANKKQRRQGDPISAIADQVLLYYIFSRLSRFYARNIFKLADNKKEISAPKCAPAHLIYHFKYYYKALFDLSYTDYFASLFFCNFTKTARNRNKSCILIDFSIVKW